jgi:DNA-binding transcriptional LysR family regulator
MHICLDWKSVKFDWNRARAFLVTAEEGSLSAAARALDMSQPTLGRQVDALEEELGVVLFERVRRGLMLTPSGHQLLEHVRKMGEVAAQLSLSAVGQSDVLEGSICIAATEITSVTILPPIIAKLRLIHPRVKVEIKSSNSTMDLKRREADIAIRNYRPTDPDLIAKKINDKRGHFYATPEYVRRIGNPKKLAELKDAEFIGFDDPAQMVGYLTSIGIDVTDENFPISAGTHHVHWEMVKEGVGIGFMPEDVGDVEPKVQRVLPEQIDLVYPLWLTTHRELKTSARVRVVFDFLAEELKRN